MSADPIKRGAHRLARGRARRGRAGRRGLVRRGAPRRDLGGRAARGDAALARGDLGGPRRAPLAEAAGGRIDVDPRRGGGSRPRWAPRRWRRWCSSGCAPPLSPRPPHPPPAVDGPGPSAVASGTVPSPEPPAELRGAKGDPLEAGRGRGGRQRARHEAPQVRARRRGLQLRGRARAQVPLPRRPARCATCS